MYAVRICKDPQRIYTFLRDICDICYSICYLLRICDCDGCTFSFSSPSDVCLGLGEHLGQFYFRTKSRFDSFSGISFFGGRFCSLF